jgi:CheY-like chemotaxis protein
VGATAVSGKDNRMDTRTPSSQPQHTTILVVDDDLAIRDVVHDALRDEGFRVVAATNHADAVTALKAVQFALILSDSMGGAAIASADPWGDLEDIRRAARNTPTVIFSAHDPRVFDGWRERGFAGFIAKPFDLDTLLHEVQAAIALA